MPAGCRGEGEAAGGDGLDGCEQEVGVGTHPVSVWLLWQTEIVGSGLGDFRVSASATPFDTDLTPGQIVDLGPWASQAGCTRPIPPCPGAFRLTVVRALALCQFA